jgi:membrane protein
MKRLPLQQILRFARFIGRRFSDDQCFEAAGALSFTTVFALVPLLTVTLSVFASFQEFQRFSEIVTSFIFRHFVPSSGTEVEAYIRQFVSKASQLTAVGIGALVISGLLLMTSIEHAFNRIWRVPVPRRALASFLVFWTVLTLGPLLVGAGLAVSSAIFAAPLFAGWEGHAAFESSLVRALPLLISLAAATLAYLVIPNCPVRLRHALAGGLFTAAAFQIAKWAFAEFVGRFANYQQIYGALAFFPVFLLWIYVSWSILLLGASLTAALGAFQRELGQPDFSERLRFPAALRILLRLREAQTTGVGVSLSELAACLPDVPEATIAGLIALFERERIAQRTDLGSFILSRDPEGIGLRTLYRADRFLLPLASDRNTEEPARSADERALQLCEQAARRGEEVFDISLAELLRLGDVNGATAAAGP